MELQTESSQRDYSLASVRNALRILKSFTMEEPEKRMADLAKTLGVGKSTISRLMLTLASEGFVVKDPESQKYRLGVSLLSLSSIVTSQLDVHRESLPVLQRIVEDINETTHVSILEGSRVTYLNTVESSHRVRFFVRVGESNPSYCTSSGKAILAFQDEQTLEEILSEELVPFTKSTIINPDQLRQNLKEIREKGYAISRSELLDGVVGIAAPIRNQSSHVFAAVSIVGPVQRMNSKNLATYANKVKDAANEISRRLGYKG
ncbi:IclR family transcriptional regulator [Ammoniphilus sp. YIM 78166]|uniref:IclR family transcriptional regulator n=1 Tax=Ammoniphilus sp. YIM 78166 TaxID=1644106 RepID=UPI00106F623C|nr:IclR family transcriptional regulator [Ammoniphilus sp. YIM 78166]